MKHIILSLLLFLCHVISVAQNIHAQRDANTGKYGLVKNGKWIIPAEYDIVGWNDEDKLGYAERNGFEAVINQEGKIITDFEFSGAYISSLLISGKYITIYKNFGDKAIYGLIDRKGKVIIPCMYSNVIVDEGSETWKSGIRVETPDHKFGMYDLNGKVLIEAKYSNIISPMQFYTQNDYHVVNIGGNYNDSDSGNNPTGGKWGAVSYEGQEVVPCKFDDVRVIDNDSGLFAINKGGRRIDALNTEGGKWGLYANGQEIVPCQFDNAPEFTNDVAKVKINGQVKLLKNPLKDASQILIASGDKSSEKKEKGPAVSRYPKPDSDVDKNIPSSKSSADNTFAFIIANENYPDAPVPYSLNDGRMFKEYCIKALGLPEKNINMYEDATYGNIITAMEKMKSVADAYDGEACIIFYYAGHGFPDEKQSTAYLLPIDGNATDITTTGHSLAKLYKELGTLKLKSAVVFLDACFSGAKREDQMLSESRGVAIKVKDEAPQGNLLVFSAAQGDETAHQMEEKHHGLFTYYLLKELQAVGGDVDMGTLTDYVTKQVKRQSVVINNKKQTPTVIPSQALTNSWRSLKLK